MAKKRATQSYDEAIGEINEILAQIDGGEVGIDALGPMVERASILIKRCREQLNATELQVREALEGLEETVDEDTP